LNSSIDVPRRSAVAAVISVAMKPGATQLAEMPKGAEFDRAGESWQAGLGDGVLGLTAIAERRGGRRGGRC
jgi:hypothetical protein